MENKIFLHSLEQIEGDVFYVKGINYQPHVIKPTVEGVYINKEDLPILDDDVLVTKDAKLYYNQATNKVFYHYFEQPKTEEDILKDRVFELEQGQANTKYILMEGGLI